MTAGAFFGYGTAMLWFRRILARAIRDMPVIAVGSPPSMVSNSDIPKPSNCAPPAQSKDGSKRT